MGVLGVLAALPLIMLWIKTAPVLTLAIVGITGCGVYLVARIAPYFKCTENQ